MLVIATTNRYCGVAQPDVDEVQELDIARFVLDATLQSIRRGQDDSVEMRALVWLIIAGCATVVRYTTFLI